MEPGPTSDLEQILGYENAALEMHAGCVDPHLSGDFRIVGRHEVREHEQLDAGVAGDAPGIRADFARSRTAACAEQDEPGPPIVPLSAIRQPRRTSEQDGARQKRSSVR